MDMMCKTVCEIRMTLCYGESPKHLAKKFGWRRVKLVMKDMIYYEAWSNPCSFNQKEYEDD